MVRSLHYTEHVSIGSLYVTPGRHVIRIFFALLQLSKQKEIDVVAGHGIVERGCQARAWRGRLQRETASQ